MFKTHVFDSVASTNLTAKELAQKGAKDGEVVIAKVQTQGRGRLDRLWHSPRGNLYLSFILRPKILAKQAPQLTFVAAVSAAECLKKYIPEGIEVKWPNDVLVQRKKICGILLEAETKNVIPRGGGGSKEDEIDFIIVGVGINVNETKFPTGFLLPPTSIQLQIKKEVDLEKLQMDFLKSFEMGYQTYLKKGFLPIQKAWQNLSVLHGQTVEIEDHGQRICGKGIGINEAGALLIEVDGGKKIPIYAGDLICF